MGRTPPATCIALGRLRVGVLALSTLLGRAYGPVVDVIEVMGTMTNSRLV